MREDEDKVVGIWIRVSTEDQARGESPEHHERRARAYAEARGWTVAEVFRLDAVSGKSVMGHPEAQRMLGLVRSGALTGLVFSKLARLARNTRELLDFAAANLPGYQRPRSVDFMQELPRMPSGKVLRRTIRDAYWQGDKKI